MGRQLANVDGMNLLNIDDIRKIGFGFRRELNWREQRSELTGCGAIAFYVEETVARNLATITSMYL